MRNVITDRVVQVDVLKLLETMKSNRAEHKLIFEEAVRGYKIACVTELESRLELVEKSDDLVSLGFDLRMPVSYVSQYDMIIEMLEWTTERTIEVGMGEFNAWVRDQWDWQVHFLTSNSGYSTMASAKNLSLS